MIKSRIVALVAALACAALAAAQPNIIFIMADDMGYGDLGVYGGKRIQTPHIDRLAAQGLRFTQVYAGHAVCAPSRNVLMTGQHTGHTTVRDNLSPVGGVDGIGGKKGRVPLNDNDVTVAEVLKKAGYATGMSGKWGLGEPGTTGLPNDQGFDEWFGHLNQARAHTYYPTYLWRNREKVDLPGNHEDPKTQYSHDMFTDFALQFIRGHAGEPFFLYVPYTVPHAEYEIPSVEPYGTKAWPEQEKVYAAMITRMDRDVGRMMALLEELGIAGDTVVFFTSDNGAANRYDGLFDSAGEFRGRKGSLYEGGIRTPMIVRWPGRIPPDTVNGTASWYFADFLPTVAEIAGVETEGRLDGVSILPTLLGEEQDFTKRIMYWESHARGFHQAARWNEWKAVRHGESKTELYNLAEDPRESDDLAVVNRRLVKDFERYFKIGRTESENWPAQ